MKFSLAPDLGKLWPSGRKDRIDPAGGCPVRRSDRKSLAQANRTSPCSEPNGSAFPGPTAAPPGAGAGMPLQGPRFIGTGSSDSALDFGPHYGSGSDVIFMLTVLWRGHRRLRERGGHRKVALAAVTRGPVATASAPPRDRRMREKRMGESATRGSGTRKPPAPASNRLQTGRDVPAGGVNASGRPRACGQIVENRIQG